MHDPARLPLDHRCGVEMIADQPNEKRRRKHGARDKQRDMFADAHIAQNGTPPRSLRDDRTHGGDSSFADEIDYQV